MHHLNKVSNQEAACFPASTSDNTNLSNIRSTGAFKSLSNWVEYTIEFSTLNASSWAIFDPRGRFHPSLRATGSANAPSIVKVFPMSEYQRLIGVVVTGLRKKKIPFTHPWPPLDFPGVSDPIPSGAMKRNLRNWEKSNAYTGKNTIGYPALRHTTNNRRFRNFFRIPTGAPCSPPELWQWKSDLAVSDEKG
jgi:hypothetical protein